MQLNRVLYSHLNLHDTGIMVMVIIVKTEITMHHNFKT